MHMRIAAHGPAHVPAPARSIAVRALRHAAQEVAALMHRFAKGNDGYISFDSFCDAVIPKDFTFGGSRPAGSALARPSTAPARHDVGTGELLRSYARAELDAADGKAVERLLAWLRTAFADRGARLAVIFREMDTTRSGASVSLRGPSKQIARSPAFFCRPTASPPPHAPAGAQARSAPPNSARRSIATTSV